jgi:hypothetical protein
MGRPEPECKDVKKYSGIYDGLKHFDCIFGKFERSSGSGITSSEKFGSK